MKNAVEASHDNAVIRIDFQLQGKSSLCLINNPWLQFEMLVLNNIEYVLEELGVKEALTEESYIGGYFQTQTQRQKACQIDILIHTKSRIFVCECKLLAEDVQSHAIQEVQQKIDKLTRDKKEQVYPVLIHGNGVSKSVENSDFFYRIIDIRDAIRG